MTVGRLMKQEDRAHKLTAYAEHIGYLRDRWQDEKEYEDWQDYIESARKQCPANFKFVKLTRSGTNLLCWFELDTLEKTTLQIKVTSKKWELLSFPKKGGDNAKG
jgi:hypothetical protein